MRHAQRAPTYLTRVCSVFGVRPFARQLKYAEDGWVDKMNASIAAGIDPEVKDDEGWTALMNASLNDHAPTVQRLIDLGVNLETRDPEGKSG